MLCMRRLTQPTFFKWMIWLSRDLERAKGLPRSSEWLINPVVAQLPLLKLWAREAQRLRRELLALNVSHGDVHDNNLVFDVFAVRDLVFGTESTAPLPALEARKVLMDCIACGPGPDAKARLCFIDFGQSWVATSCFERCLLIVCGHGDRLVDPEEALAELEREKELESDA